MGKKDKNYLTWGWTKFSHSKEDFFEIVALLCANQRNERKAFSLAWTGGCFKNRPRHEAEFVVGMIHRINCLMELFGTNPETVCAAYSKNFCTDDNHFKTLLTLICNANSPSKKSK